MDGKVMGWIGKEWKVTGGKKVRGGRSRGRGVSYIIVCSPYRPTFMVYHLLSSILHMDTWC